MNETKTIYENHVEELFDLGCCVDLTVMTWQARTGSKKILTSFGIKDLPNDEFITNGQIKFVSNKQRKSFHQHEIRARLWLENNSFPFLNARFVPDKAVKILLDGYNNKPGLKKLKELFDLSVLEFLNDFDKTREEYINSLRLHDGLLRNAFVGNYPEKETIKPKFQFNWILYNMSSAHTDSPLLQQEASKLIENGPRIIRTRLLENLNKFKRMLMSNLTVKTSSINAMRNSLVNYCILNFTGDPFEKNVNDFYETLLQIQNIEAKDKDTKNKILLETENIISQC